MLAPFPDRLGSSNMEMLQLEKKMELHNMEKLETHLFSSGSRGFLLTRVVVPKYTERQVAVYSTTNSNHWIPRVQFCASQDRPTASLWLPPTRRLERGTFQKEIPRLAGGDVGQRLWERGQDVSCAVAFPVSLGCWYG